MVEVVRYSLDYKTAWDAFVANSKNGTFLFFRDYMAYHADRFRDHSLLFYRKGKLVAVLPANEAGSEFQTHGGLSYGGVVSNSRMKAPVMLSVFEAMLQYLKGAGFDKILYKAVPHIYHRSPAEEDLYALFRNGAELVRRDLNSVIDLRNALAYSKLRKRKLNEAQKYKLELRESDDFKVFMKLQQDVLLTRYNLKPVHSIQEITQLAFRFPECIKLYAAYENDNLAAGILLYETQTVAHCQYIGANERGRQISALDALTDFLVTQVYPHKHYFSFGISTEQQGESLNENLVRNKESYGARSVVQDFYALKL